MFRIPKLVLFFGVITFSLATLVQAQEKAIRPKLPVAESSDRAQDGLIGPVRRVRVETAQIIVKEGKTVEGPRRLQAITTYDPVGHKVDSVAYPVEGNNMSGKEHYRYDAKGNIIEMVLRGDDGSLLSKETYQYDFDELGNWKKMLASIAVIENGSVNYEPIEVTYRTITYYLAQAVARAAATAVGTTATKKAPPVTSTNISAQPEKPATEAPTPSRVAEPESSTSELKTATSLKASTETADESKPATKTAAPESNVDVLPVVRVSEDVLRKSAIELPEPEYPADAASARVEGKVEVQFLIDDKGEVTAVRPISGNPMLTEAAANAARKARFLASKLSRQPARVFGVVTYDFALASKDLAAPMTAEASNPVAPVDTGRATREVVSAPSPVETRSPLPVADNSSGASGSSSSVASPNNNEQPAPKSLAFATPFEKGMASLSAAKYDAAVQFFREVIRADPSDALAYCKLGLTYSALNQPKEAITAYKQAIKLKRAFVDADSYYRLGTSYIALNDYLSAVEPLKQALYMIRAQGLEPQARKRAAPAEFEAHHALGLAYFGSGSFRNAANEFESAVKLKPDFASAHYGLGLSHLGYGDKQGAQKQEEVLRKLKSPLADKLQNALLAPVRRNKVF